MKSNIHENNFKTSNMMSKTLKLLSLVVIILGVNSCSSDDDDNTPQFQIEADIVANLYAPQEGGQGTGEPESGDFIKFDFATGTTTTSDTDWDIAFRGTKILVNGGVSTGLVDEPERTGNAAAYLGTGELDDIDAVNTDLLEQDSVNGLVLSNWYTYAGPPTHEIKPTAGKILVIRTRSGAFAKVEILSYYQDAQPNETYTNFQYYTFNYVYNPNEGDESFE